MMIRCLDQDKLFSLIISVPQSGLSTPTCKTPRKRQAVTPLSQTLSRHYDGVDESENSFDSSSSDSEFKLHEKLKGFEKRLKEIDSNSGNESIRKRKGRGDAEKDHIDLTDSRATKKSKGSSFSIFL
jgi:hypothetical protein